MKTVILIGMMVLLLPSVGRGEPVTLSWMVTVEERTFGDSAYVPLDDPLSFVLDVSFNDTPGMPYCCGYFGGLYTFSPIPVGLPTLHRGGDIWSGDGRSVVGGKAHTVDDGTTALMRLIRPGEATTIGDWMTLMTSGQAAFTWVQYADSAWRGTATPLVSVPEPGVLLILTMFSLSVLCVGRLRR